MALGTSLAGLPISWWSPVSLLMAFCLQNSSVSCIMMYRSFEIPELPLLVSVAFYIAYKLVETKYFVANLLFAIWITQVLRFLSIVSLRPLVLLWRQILHIYTEVLKQKYTICSRMELTVPVSFFNCHFRTKSYSPQKSILCVKFSILGKALRMWGT